MNNVKAVFTQQVGVFLRVRSLYIRTEAGGELWNVDARQGCGAMSSIDTHLDTFREWVASSATPECDGQPCGVWHLWTNCADATDYQDASTKGKASVKALCPREDGRNAAMSNDLGSNSWRLMAHELGHNFGAKHTVGGLMRSGIKSSLSSFEDNGQICTALNYFINEHPACFKPYTSSNGPAPTSPSSSTTFASSPAARALRAQLVRTMAQRLD